MILLVRKKDVLAFVLSVQALFLLMIGPATMADTTRPKVTETQNYISLDTTFSQLRSQFNSDRGKTRVVAIIGPSCGGCLMGMKHVNDNLLQREKDNPNLITYVIYVPTLGATESHIPDAAELITTNQAYHYWDKSGNIGKAFQAQLGLNDYIWDAWFVYDSEAQWQEKIPSNHYWMRRKTRNTPKDGAPLNGKAFAAKVQQLLATTGKQ
jgi:hypothetical protein